MTDRAHEPLEVTLRQLKQERDEADRRYNDALTALDRSHPPAPSFPPTPKPYDEHQITPLNEAWNILPGAPDGGGLKGRLAGFVWRTIAPYLQRQLTFNSLLVDHLNRNVASHREARQGVERAMDAVREYAASLAGFHAHLMLYLQQITAYVDTKDRETAGGGLVLNASLGALGDELAKRWESMLTREQRFESRTKTIESAHEELKSAIGVTQHATQAIKRELERLGGVQGIEGVQRTREARAVEEGRDAFASPLDAYKYVGFEDQFRGSREVIRQRLESYIPFFEGVRDVLDVGCGRGEFLDLLQARGITARGIDVNHEMAESCRARGLDVTEADAVGYLSRLDDGALGGVFAAQVVEHLQPGYLLRFLELAFHKLRPGGRIVLETLNPACWVAFFESYIRDITHVWPLHPETLKYLVVASGFPEAQIEYRSPVSKRDRLQLVEIPAGADLVLREIVETLNTNTDQLNSRMFAFLDYAIIGSKRRDPATQTRVLP